MTTLRDKPSSELGKDLQWHRAERPDEWTMDNFTRMAEELHKQLATIKQDSIIALEEALKAMLINGFSDECVPVVKVKYQIKKLKE